MPIAIDATYSVGDELSGVGIYSREILNGLAAAHPGTPFLFCYRPKQFFRSYKEKLFPNCSRFLLHDQWRTPPRGDLFHGLNQRMPPGKMKYRVCTFHDLFVMTGDYSTPDFRQLFTARAKLAAERSDLIIAVSKFTAGQVEDLLKVDPSRIRVVHHGIREPEDRSVPPRENLILHVGAIQDRKNITRLVEAFESLPNDWNLVLAGSASGFGSEAIIKRIEVSSCRERIQITGYLSAPALDRLYSRAGIFAFPSLDEGFGMPVLEAMSRNIPVLTSNRSALPEVTGDAALLIDPADTASIAHGLTRLMEDSELRTQLIAAGKQQAEKFTWHSAVDKTWETYRELTGAES